MPTTKCQQKPKKNSTVKLLNWDAHYVGIKATKELQHNCITLDEIIFLVLKHPSFRCANIITQGVVEFTSLAVSDLNGSMAYLRKPYLSKHFNSLNADSQPTPAAKR